MAYIDYAYYTTEYIGESVAETDFARYLNRAEEAIDCLTGYAVKTNGLTTYDNLTQEQIKKAVASQVEYYVFEGIDVANGGKSQTGFTVGKVSVSGNAIGANTVVSPKALSLLEQTGLLCRTVGVC